MSKSQKKDNNEDTFVDVNKLDPVRCGLAAANTPCDFAARSCLIFGPVSSDPKALVRPVHVPKAAESVTVGCREMPGSAGSIWREDFAALGGCTIGTQKAMPLFCSSFSKSPLKSGGEPFTAVWRLAARF